GAGRGRLEPAAAPLLRLPPRPPLPLPARAGADRRARLGHRRGRRALRRLWDAVRRGGRARLLHPGRRLDLGEERRADADELLAQAPARGVLLGELLVPAAGRGRLVRAGAVPRLERGPGGPRRGGRAVFDQTIFALRSKFDGTVWSADRGGRRLRGYCYADTSYSTVPAYKSASLWYRMEAFDDAAGGTTALAVLIPPEGSRSPAQ